MTALFVLVGSGAIGAMIVSGLGCGGGDSSAGTGAPDSGGASDASTAHDGSPPLDAGSDSNVPPLDAPVDSPADVGVDAPVVPPPTGTRLATTTSAEIVGVTSDGYVVYFDFGNDGLWAVDTSAPDAGAPILIGTLGGPTWGAVVRGAVVFAWSNVPAQPAPQVAALTVWSKATGAHPIASKTQAWFAAASGDGSKVVYATSDATGAVGDITGVGTDGSSPVVLVSQATLAGQPACKPQIEFVGAGQTDAVVAYCLPTDAGASTATLDAFSGGSWTKKTLTTGLNPSNENLIAPLFAFAPYNGNVFVVDATFTNILSMSAANQAVAITYPGAVVSNLESGAAAPGFFVGGSGTLNAVYPTQTGAIHASSVPPTTPTTLVTSGANVMFTVPSPDGKWGIYGSTTGTAVGLTTSDLALFATSPAATTKTVESAADAFMAGQGPYPFFTADSSHLLWYNNVVGSTSANWASLHSYDLAAGSSSLVAGNVWEHWATGSGSTIVYDDNSRSAGTSYVADIKLVDLAVSPFAPKTLQLDADPNFALTPDLKTVVYAYTQGTAAQNGIYAIPAQ